MLKDKEKLYQAYHTLLSLALTWALVLVINQYFVLRVPLILTIVLSFLPSLFICLFILNRKNVISYMLLGSIIPLLALFFWLGKSNPIHWFKDFVQWCELYNKTEELYEKQYAYFVVISVAILGAILFHLLMKKQFAKIILTFIIIAALVILCLNKENVNKAVVAISIFYILSVVVEVYGSICSKKSGRQEKKEGILYLAPICLLLAVMAISLPSKEEPIQWNTVKKVYRDFMEQIEVWQTDLSYYFGSNQSEFAISLTGYSESRGRLGASGKVKEDSKIALKVSQLDQGDAVYLTGSISNVYTGSSWEKSKKDFIPEQIEYVLDYMELYKALSRQRLDVLENNQFINRKNMQIDYNTIKTKTFFYPIKTCEFNFLTSNSKVSKEAAQITFRKAHGKGTSYYNIFYDMNLQGEAFQRMLKQANLFSYHDPEVINQESATWLQVHKMFNDDVSELSEVGDIYELLGQRAELIYTQDTKLPDTLPDRVVELAKTITTGYATDYNKLKAIETYLRGYTYTLNPKPVPEGVDFTDYFLFESKEGYCTSFATAMAVLSRCVGIPTRYVEGFVAECDKLEEDKFYAVKNSQAHAWAEAYLEGVGWIPFEATPPYYDTRYTKWVDTSKLAVAGNYSTVPYDYASQIIHTGPRDIDSLKQKDDNNLNQVLLILIICISVIISILGTILVYYQYLKHRYNKAFTIANNNKKMYMTFIRILNLLMREGFTLNQQETILMFSKRIKDLFMYEDVTFPYVADIYMRYRYADSDITNKEFKRVYLFYQGLSNKKREEESRFKVWLDEFIFLMKKGDM